MFIVKLHLGLFLVLLVLHTAFAQHNPLKDPNICGRPTCKGNEKFRYRPDIRQDYTYTVDVVTLFNGTSKNESTLHVSASITLDFISECDGLLTVSDLRLSEKPTVPDCNYEDCVDSSLLHSNSEIFSEKISEFSLRFSFQDGIISELCPVEEESNWVLNFKRGLLSMLHNSMKRFDLDYSTTEDDVRGKCDTTYKVLGPRNTSLIISKTKNLNSCEKRSKIHSFLQSTPYQSRSNYHSESLIKSTSYCELSVDHHIYNDIRCEESHVFQPFSNQASGATTTVKQRLILKSEEEAILEEQPSITKRVSLLYDQVPTLKPTSGELKISRDLLKQLCKLSEEDVQEEFSDLFTKFIHTYRLLSHVALSSLYEHSNSICITGKKHMLDVLPYLGSSASVALMKDIIINRGVSDDVMHEWLIAIAFIPRPSDEMLETAYQLLEYKSNDSSITLGIAALTHTFCTQNIDCYSNEPTKQIVTLLENNAVRIYKSMSIGYQTQDALIITLKALANIGVTSNEFKEELFNMIKNQDLDIAVRVAAVETFRRLPCEVSRPFFEEFFRNQDEDAEVRIAAYLQVMRCPNYIVIRTVRHSLQVEEVNQVGTFIWSHLHNLLKSSIPSRVEIQSLLSDKDLGRKFSSDVRKFSHNYEGSVYFDEYNVGANYESNVIFSPSSYIPRSAMLNLSVDLFGESINLLEVGGRIEGFEHYVESIFGPKGPLNAKKLQDKIPKMRWPRSMSENEVLKSQIDNFPNAIKNGFGGPKVSLGLKVFGNELKYSTFNGEDEIKDALRTLSPMDHFKNILSGKEINYNKAAMFLDSSYVVPTSAGFPITLNAVGTASVNLKLFGALRAADFMKTKELDLVGDLRPSGAVDIVGTMSVDAYYASTAIKLKTNMYTSSAVEGSLKIRGTDLVSVKFSFPREKTEIFGAQSELIVMKGEAENRQKGLQDNRVSQSACSWPVVDKTIGLKLCAHYHFVNVTKIDYAPYFILAGPAGFRLSLQKADPTAKTYSLEYKWIKSDTGSDISIVFDTPGSAVRRLTGLNLSLDTQNNNITLAFHSTSGNLMARGKYKNTKTEKYLQLALNIDNKKHLDVSLSLDQKESRNGYTYIPKAYLGVNGERVAELQGSLKWVTKKGISQCDVDLKFQTKRLSSKLFGYISKSDASIGTNLKLDYKFVNTKEQRAILEFSLANRSTRTLVAVLGDIRVETTAYPQFNFEAALKFQKATGRMECKFDIYSSPNLRDRLQDDPNRLTIVLEIKHKMLVDGMIFETKAAIQRITTNLDVGGEFVYYIKGPDTSIKSLIKYAKEREVAATIFWSHPRRTFEYYEGHINVSLPSYTPMLIEWKVNEKRSSDYAIELRGTWFTGHTVSVRGIYQDKSTVRASDHHLKVFLKSPSFQEIDADCQFYRDDAEIKTDLKARHNNDEYGLFYKHIVSSQFEMSTQGRIKYKTQVYSLTSSLNLRERKQILLELHFDQLRDIHLSMWGHNKETQKTAGMEIKWDANRDPNQKLAVTVEFSNPESYNYTGNFILTYPGRIINGIFDFAIKDEHFLTRTRLTWNPTDIIGFSLGVDYKNNIETMIIVKSEVLTPFEEWKRNSFNMGYRHVGNMYRLNGSLYWHQNQHVSFDIFGDYLSSNSHVKYEFTSTLLSTIEDLLYFNINFKHNYNTNKVDTHLLITNKPKDVFALRSSWHIDEDNKMKNLTGTVSFVSPFEGYSKGLLVSKVYVTKERYLRGVADLDINHRKYTASIEGHYQKLFNSMFVFNISTPIRKYEKLTGQLGLSEENKHLIALIQYPTGTLGIEIKFLIKSLQCFDVKFSVATPVEILQKILLVALLKPEKADFRLGWNSLLAGFSGVWHYANVTDFEYSYKIYTPIEGFEENGIVAKLIFKEGLDFEVSVKLAENRLGVAVLGKPKPKILNELGIKTQAIYIRKLAGDADDDEEDEDYDYEDEIEEPISWSGFLEIDTIMYPTIKGSMDIDQKGTLYVLLGTLTLPGGTADFKDEFDFVNVFTMNNKLYITTPYVNYKTITSDYDFEIIMGSLYKLGIDVNYQNRNQWIKTGGSVLYTVEVGEEKEVAHNVTFHVHTPFKSFPRLDLHSSLGMEEHMYQFNFALTTNNSNVSIEANMKMVESLLDTKVAVHVVSPLIIVPSSRFNFKKEFSELENRIQLNLDMLRDKPTKFNVVTVWKYHNITNFRAKLDVESPFTGLEKAELGTSVFFVNNNGLGEIRILLFPINFKANATLKDNELNSWIETEFHKERRYMKLECNVIRTVPNGREFQGHLKVGDKVYIVTGSGELSQNNLPVKVHIQIAPQEGGHPFHIQYELLPRASSYSVMAKLLQGQKFIQIEADTTFKTKEELNIHLKISTSNKRYTTFICDTHVINGEIHKSLTLNVKTPFENLENPRLHLFFTKSDVKRKSLLSYQSTHSKGTLEAEWCWLLMENMSVKLISNYESENSTQRSTAEVFFINPNKTYNSLLIGADANFNEMWKAGSTLKVVMASRKNLEVEADIRMPNAEIHYFNGKLYSTTRLDNIEYLAHYRTRNSGRNYRSSGKIVYPNKNNINGNISLHWDQNHIINYLNWKRLKNDLNLMYRLRTAKFDNQDTFVTNISYKGSEPYHNVTCELFYPENRSIAAARVDFQEFANMNGTVNITTPYEKFKYLAAHFTTETSGIIHNRNIELFWPSNMAYLNSKCTITTGTSVLERDTIGVLLVEIPLTTRHFGRMDYSYSERPNRSTGRATVDYNKEKILEGRYNCLSESRAGFDKDTIHVELENKLVPVGIAYVHGYEYSAPGDGSNVPTVDSKRLEVYHLHNQSGFNVTGEMYLRTTFTGQQIVLTAIHSNRTVKFWTDYDVLDQQFKQHSKLELDSSVWVAYDLDILNKTMDENTESQQIQINLSYPKREFTTLGSYSITNSSLASEISLLWDERKKNLEAALYWKKEPSPDCNHHEIEIQFKHPSFEKNVSILGEYETTKNKLLDMRLTVDYSTNPNQKLQLTGLIEDTSALHVTNYTYTIWGSHPATNLYLLSRGGIYLKPRWYFIRHLLDYKRTYLPLQTREAFARLDFDNKEIELKKKSLRELSYLWTRYTGKFPLYIANLSAIHGKDINASGEFYLNLREKLLQLELNMTEDGSQSLHAYGIIPDARNAAFDSWRDYEDIRVSDVSYFLSLNHSRLIVSSLRWRPEIKQDIQNGIRVLSVELYNDIVDTVDYWKQYIRSETADAVADVWQDAKPLIKNFLDDLKDLRVIDEDFQKFKIYLNNSYNANEFYVRDVVGFVMHLVDELAIRSHIESLPKIVNEIWEIMGESGLKLQKGLLWVIEKLKTYYKNTAKFINGLFEGDSLEHISDALAQLVESYDTVIKDLHVSFIRYIENLWKQTYAMLLDNWYKALAAIEPTFIKIIHYLETVAWKTSKDFLDFLYIRQTEIFDSPYFSRVSEFTHDLDKFYKDITGNNTISNLYKYSKVIYKFINEKYLKSIPFKKELEAIVTEITNELNELRNLPAMQYLIEKQNEIHEKLKWFCDYFEVENKIQRFLSLIHTKITQFSMTALQAENKYREAKTKFIFEPNEGVMYLEQKLPMSWHAFNETPKIQEIPEYRAINDIQNYFVTSKTNFWNFYYDYKPYTDPTDWLPPFKAQAMIAGSQYYVTFDRTFYNFRGGCSYLLASDFLDRNFSIAISNDDRISNAHELLILVNNTMIRLDLKYGLVTLNNRVNSRLPTQIGDLYLYQDSDIITLESTSGFVLQCNMKFDVCMLELSGWYFGKTAGLWGTMNNEPSDDLLTSDGRRTKSDDINRFAESWALDGKCFSPITEVPNASNPSEEVQALCEVFFSSKVSPFGTCFPRVPTSPFLDMCLSSSSENEACTSAVAYMNLCSVENTPLRIPEACVKCDLMNGSTVPEGEFVLFEGNAVPRSTDIVFIVEAKKCNEALRSTRNMDLLTEALSKELSTLNITKNRYSIVTFGGNGVFDQPRSVLMNGNVFADYESFNSYFDGITIGNGNSDIFGAIIFATKLVFRPGVSKTFILLPCTDCHESNMKLDYAILHQLLLENDITLHILMNEEFLFQKARVNKIFFGIDRSQAFTKKDVRELKGDTGLLKQVHLPKSTLGFCTPLALESNGSVFSAKKLETDKKNAVKRFAIVFGKRVAKSAIPSKCLMCECTAPNTGVAYMECFPCSYPTPATIDYGFNEDETLSVIQPLDEESFDYSN